MCLCWHCVSPPPRSVGPLLGKGAGPGALLDWGGWVASSSVAWAKVRGRSGRVGPSGRSSKSRVCSLGVMGRLQER